MSKGFRQEFFGLVLRGWLSRFSTSGTRGAKRASLVKLLETEIKELYSRQLTMLCSRAEKSYKSSLLKLLDSDKLDEDSEAEVLRKVRSLIGASAIDAP